MTDYEEPVFKKNRNHNTTHDRASSKLVEEKAKQKTATVNLTPSVTWLLNRCFLVICHTHLWFGLFYIGGWCALTGCHGSATWNPMELFSVVGLVKMGVFSWKRSRIQSNIIFGHIFFYIMFGTELVLVFVSFWGNKIGH